MSRLEAAFKACRARGELALVPYLTGGFPDGEQFLRRLDEVVAAGADVVEIGIPFSDPIADGPTIQHSSQVALDAGFELGALLEALADRPIEDGPPRVMMSYLNPLLAYGRERLLAEMPKAGFAGLIIPDLPVEEAAEWTQATAAHGIDLVFLAAPTSDAERLAQIGQVSRGFIYVVSLAGTTGARRELWSGLPAMLKRLRAASDKPLAVGFGISTPEHIRGLQGLADGVVVGSRLVEAIRTNEDLSQLVRTLKDATRGAPSCLSS